MSKTCPPRCAPQKGSRPRKGGRDAQVDKNRSSLTTDQLLSKKHRKTIQRKTPAHLAVRDQLVLTSLVGVIGLGRPGSRDGLGGSGSRLLCSGLQSVHELLPQGVLRSGVCCGAQIFSGELQVLLLLWIVGVVGCTLWRNRGTINGRWSTLCVYLLKRVVRITTVIAAIATVIVTVATVLLRTGQYCHETVQDQ